MSEFKAFSAKPSLSMADTPLGVDVPEPEDEVDALTQSVELRFGNISLEQVRHRPFHLF